jgi:hypothetical protein
VRCPLLRDIAHPFFETMAGLMERQTTTSPPTLPSKKQRHPNRLFWKRLSCVEELETSSTFGQLYFHLGDSVAGLCTPFWNAAPAGGLPER